MLSGCQKLLAVTAAVILCEVKFCTLQQGIKRFILSYVYMTLSGMVLKGDYGFDMREHFHIKC